MAAVPDTIFALSTAQGRAGVAVIRVSGPQAWTSFARIDSANIPLTPRQTSLRKLTSPTTQAAIDHAMVVGFRGPHSFTGEDCIEYHIHGGHAVTAALLATLSDEDGHRMALPGEFTRRAFENGKIDLTAAEAVADLIHAETESQRLQALAQMDGNLFQLYEGWKDRVAHILAFMEADLDFSDQDLPEDILLKVRPDLADIRRDIRTHLADGRRGEILRDGYRVVILGAPNAGKSSLLNALAQREAAIVSPVAGTTRDMIDVHLNVGGYAVLLTDTAGLRQEALGESAHDRIEAEGIRRALARAAEADLKILLLDGTLEQDKNILNLIDDNTLLVVNKMDAVDFRGTPENAIAISAKTQKGIDSLLHRILESLAAKIGQNHSPALTRARHREALTLALDYLDRSLEAPLPELAAEDLRLALRAIGSITGRVDIEDLLDMIFRDFCIGK